MKIKKQKSKKFEEVSKLGEWKDKFFKDNGSIEDQLIESCETPTTYKNKIKAWFADNPRPS